MKTIQKFELEIKDVQMIRMPKDAQILEVSNQFEKPCIWALVDTEREREWRLFLIFDAGIPIQEEEIKDISFVGSFKLHDEIFVFIFFEKVGYNKNRERECLEG